MTDNVVLFPGGSVPESEKKDITPDTLMEKAIGRYDELIIVGRAKDSGRYECVSTMDIPETLYHVVRIQHRLHLYLDGNPPNG